jgi:pyridoxal phosphate enzyme (YggS family)
LQAVRERIAAAAIRAGRDPGEIQLIAVSKTFDALRVLELARFGQLVFGENRVQEAGKKIPTVTEAWAGPALTWRLVGHLQRNKVRAALEVFDTVDSVDSLRLIDALAVEAERRQKVIPVLLEFNCSGEEAKSGFQPGDAPTVADRLREEGRLDFRGLMTIGPLAEPEAARPAFQKLREVREEMQDRLSRPLPELSMGMSGDFEIGIEEGATVVRVGTALFGSRG